MNIPPRVELGGEAGLRCGEMMALEWADVNLAKRRLTVQRSDWKGQVTPTKGGRVARAIQDLAGHQDLSTTQRYMHLSPAAIDSAIRLLDRRQPSARSSRPSLKGLNKALDQTRNRVWFWRYVGDGQDRKRYFSRLQES